jgi:hypothetical protein
MEWKWSDQFKPRQTETEDTLYVYKFETNGEESVVRKIKLKPVRNRLSLLILSKIKNNFKTQR